MWSKSRRLIVPRKTTKMSVGVCSTSALASPASTSPSCDTAPGIAAPASLMLPTLEPTLAPPP
jgi:hypothetical protein